MDLVHVCGCAIYQYEHLKPSSPMLVNIVQRHRPAMRKVPRSKDAAISLCRDRQSGGCAAACKETGFSNGEFDLGAGCSIIRIGETEFHNVKTLSEISGESILSILQPEALGLPFRINAFVTDRDGNSILEIVENEWRAPTYNWDVETSGGCITIRSGPRHVARKLRTAPPTTLIVERLDMEHRGTAVRCLDGTNWE